MSESRTPTGRALLEHMTEDAAGFIVVTSRRFSIQWVLDALAKDIPAIEAEAVAAYRAELAEQVRGLRTLDTGGLGFQGERKPHLVLDRAAVLRLIEEVASPNREPGA